MPLTLVRSRSNASLWSTCAGRFLDEVGKRVGPTGYPSYLWIAHRNQRDALHELAASRGLPGWIDPPVSFLSELPALFGIRGQPVGTLTRRFLVARLGAEAARAVGFRAAPAGREGERSETDGSANRVSRTPMLDALFGELLPEGVSPGTLRRALQLVGDDEFAVARNDWIAASYESYLHELTRRGLYDARGIHAAVARRIEEGALSEALRGAGILHVYGMYTPHVRRRLLASLRDQKRVDVRVYVVLEDETGEWEGLGASVEDLPPARSAREPAVQPAPDAVREARWIAGEVKRRIREAGIEPHEIAVVARSGREDTRRIQRAFMSAGIPSTARVRTPLVEIPALKSILELFRGCALDWPYRPLRQVLSSPYFRIGIDLRALDRIAARRRPEGLAGWVRALELILDVELDSADGKRLRREGIRRERVERDLTRFRSFAASVAGLAGSRSELAWIEATLGLMSGDWLDFRRRVCAPAGERWDIVRLDQRGVRNLEALLQDWRRFADTRQDVGPGEWHARLRRLLEGSEIALSTPLQKGVQVLEAHEAALTPFRATFVVHANDGVFPRRSAVSGLLSDEERELLSRETGLPLTHRRDHLRRERTLWRAVASQAEVTVTYRTADADGTPRLPSLMVPAHDPGDELPRTFDLDAEPLSVAQASWRAAREFAAARRRRMGEMVGSPEPIGLSRAVVAAYAESRRAGVQPSLEEAPLRPGPWHGQIRDPVVLASLNERFASDYSWSASQLQLYSGCPFLFLVERVLWLDDVGEVEEETSPLVFGSLAHAALERFYRQYLERPLPDSLDDEARARCEEAIDGVIRTAEETGEWVGSRALWAAAKRSLREGVLAFVAWELGVLRKQGERPFRVEHPFGYGDTPPLRLRGSSLTGGSRQLLLRGRIDRVDTVGEGDLARFHILDYKSGSYPGRQQYEDGSLLQTPLYMEAMAQAEGLAVSSGYFRSIKGRQTQHASKVVRGDSRYLQALATAFTIPDRIRQGLFEPVKSWTTEWREFEPGIEVTRTRAQLPTGTTRYDATAARGASLGPLEVADD